MRDQEKRAAIVLAKDNVTAQKKLKKHAAASEAIVGYSSQNISQLKHEVLFQKKDRYRERLAGDDALLQERAMGKETLLLDQKISFQPINQTKAASLFCPIY